MADILHVDIALLDGKIGELKTVKTSLDDSKIEGLLFGAENVPESRGASAQKMGQVNRELKTSVGKFSVLVDATIQYLETVKTTFIEADSQG